MFTETAPSDHWGGYGDDQRPSPYHENRIALDINDLENDVELKAQLLMIPAPRPSSLLILEQFRDNQQL